MWFLLAVASLVKAVKVVAVAGATTMLSVLFEEEENRQACYIAVFIFFGTNISVKK